jgi:hypothetical protein
MNCFNDMKRGVLAEVGKNLETANLLTDDVKEVLDTMVFSIKTNKKVKKEKKPRFSGYHLFMKEHRVTVKEENPEIKPQELTSVVSKAWKSIGDDKKKDFNDRASANKEEYFLNKKSSLENDDTSSADEKVDKKGVKEKKEKVVKEKGVKKEKVVKEKGVKKEKVVKEKGVKKEKVVKEKGVKKEKSIEKKDDENIVQEVVVEAEPEKVFDEPEEEEEKTILSPPDSEDEEENYDSDIDL